MIGVEVGICFRCSDLGDPVLDLGYAVVGDLSV